VGRHSSTNSSLEPFKGMKIPFMILASIIFILLNLHNTEYSGCIRLAYHLP
jgi:hypothetical protein